MKGLVSIAIIVCAMTIASEADAQFVSPTEPLVPLSDHHQEDHSGHNHRSEDVHGINLRAANLTGADFSFSTLTDADLTAALVANADFQRYWDGQRWYGTGLTQLQLESTASFKAKDLHGIRLAGNDLTGWDFSEQNLTSAAFNAAVLTNVNLSGSNLTSSSIFRSTLAGADFSGADLTDANLSESVLTNANFAGANLASAYLFSSTLTNANMRDTNLAKAYLGSTNLTDVELTGANLTDASLEQSTLTSADLSGANLTGANFSSATLSEANLSESLVRNAKLIGTVSKGFSQAQIQSTASYRTKNLQGIHFGKNDLTDWDFSGQDLTAARFDSATLTTVGVRNKRVKSSVLAPFFGWPDTVYVNEMTEVSHFSVFRRQGRRNKRR